MRELLNRLSDVMARGSRRLARWVVVMVQSDFQMDWSSEQARQDGRRESGGRVERRLKWKVRRSEECKGGRTVELGDDVTMRGDGCDKDRIT